MSVDDIVTMFEYWFLAYLIGIGFGLKAQTWIRMMFASTSP